MIEECLQRGVEVFYLVPSEPMGAVTAARKVTDEWKKGFDSGEVRDKPRYGWMVSK